MSDEEYVIDGLPEQSSSINSTHRGDTRAESEEVSPFSTPPVGHRSISRGATANNFSGYFRAWNEYTIASEQDMDRFDTLSRSKKEHRAFSERGGRKGGWFAWAFPFMSCATFWCVAFFWTTVILAVLLGLTAKYENMVTVAADFVADNIRWWVWVLIGGVLLCLSLLPVVCYAIDNLWRKMKIARKRSRKKKAHAAIDDVPQGRGIDNEISERILTATATELLDWMASGELSSEAVVRCFCQQAKFCGDAFNCIADDNFEYAVDMARRLDTRLLETGELAGPLHGLPISFKDCFDIEGLDSTLGTEYRCFKPAHRDAVLVQLFKEAGAIPFTKTNAMQALCGMESNNPIFGSVRNPWDVSRTSGGSSGGEAVLVSAFGSPLGMGTDIGGSIRTPAHFCGCCGFKPTPERVTKVGQGGAGLGQQAVADSAGPLARTVDDIALALRVLFSTRQNDLDPSVPPLIFDDMLYSAASGPTKLRIGYFTEGPHCEIFSACSRAVMETKEALEEQGHELVPFQIPDPSTFLELYVSLMTADGMAALSNLLKESSVNWSLWMQLFTARMPSWMRVGTSFVVQYVLREHTLGRMMRRMGERSVGQLHDLVKQKREYEQRFLQGWRESKLDMLLCPAAATVAFPVHTQAKLSPFISSFNMLFNLLGCPAGVVPVTRVIDEDITQPRSRASRGDKVLFSSERDSSGMPVGVQVTALPYKDEMVLGLMAQIENLAEFKNLDFKAYLDSSL